jgi:hypothetical protein
MNGQSLRQNAHRIIDLANRIERVILNLQRVPETRIAALRFRKNIARISCVAALPWTLIHDFMIYGQCVTEAARIATNGAQWRLDKLTIPQMRVVETEFKRLVKKTFRSANRKRDAEKGLAISKAKEAFNRLISTSGNSKKIALEATMASIIIGSWTSFEALAEDLWVEALNSRPRLGLIVLDAEIRQSDSQKIKDKKMEVGLPHDW